MLETNPTFPAPTCGGKTNAARWVSILDVWPHQAVRI
jgi:hypothetical protein